MAASAIRFLGTTLLPPHARAATILHSRGVGPDVQDLPSASKDGWRAVDSDRLRSRRGPARFASSSPRSRACRRAVSARPRGEVTSPPRSAQAAGRVIDHNSTTPLAIQAQNVRAIRSARPSDFRSQAARAGRRVA